MFVPVEIKNSFLAQVLFDENVKYYLQYSIEELGLKEKVDIILWQWISASHVDGYVTLAIICEKMIALGGLDFETLEYAIELMQALQKKRMQDVALKNYWFADSSERFACTGTERKMVNA